MKRILSLIVPCCFLLLGVQVDGQITHPVNGVQEMDVVCQAYTNANIQVDPETLIEGGTLVICSGKVLAVGKEVEIPAGSIIRDMEGMYIYPSFIDLSSDYGLPEVKKAKWNPVPQYESKKTGAFGWNQCIKPETDASQLWAADEKRAKTYRKNGFGSVLSHQKDGVARGSSALVTLGSEDHRSLLISQAAAHYSLNKGSSRQNYPSSEMGAIALLRQTYCDAMWYSSEMNTSEGNLSLEAWNRLQELPQFFESKNKLQILRADSIAKEFGVRYIYYGKGDEYQRIDEIKETGASLVIPLTFPDPYDVSDPYLERFVSLGDMKHWELAPYNLAQLENHGIQFCITSSGLQDAKDFIPNLRKAVRSGLSEKAAMEALTTVPAELIGAQTMLGSLQAGMEGNFLICSGNFFEEGTLIHENWIQGERLVVNSLDAVDLSGKYELTIKDESIPLEVKGEIGKQKGKLTWIHEVEDEDGKLVMDTTTIAVKIDLIDRQVSMNIKHDDWAGGVMRLNGNVFKDSKIWEGKGTLADGRWVDWVAVKKKSFEPEEQKKNHRIDSLDTDLLTYPLMAYGWHEKPEQEYVLFKNVTLWTLEGEGKIEHGELLMRDGKIVAVGQRVDVDALFPKDAIKPKVIDGTGKHLSPGIIDEHSHIAVSGSVNEGTQASSAEVSIGTVVDSDDINIYRQLAGGVTAAQLLHGSANPIGGQSGIIKMRWGNAPKDMLIESSVPFIKFALGENVKQSNWGSYQTIRFPQTRMGVEQVYYDHFIRARAYDQKWADYKQELDALTPRQLRKGELPVQPRRDLELECLAEILNAERFITCHSYRQDEINMLMHVADSMDFTLNTFTHILEGYKVADKMKAHGAGGSTFSDWWAYKYEVKDATPYNAAVLYEQGIVTAINSDDAEMARRLNQEAAKAHKYGGVPEVEALKMVTLNPAILLHLDDRMGSLLAGKDADLVLWDDNPLSIYAQVEMTFVDGRCYYSVEKDEELRQEMQEERTRLVQQMLTAGEGGARMQKPRKKRKKHLCCESFDDGSENYVMP